ncbi:MAG: HAD-IC family P-type ATPase, partial [Gammaproteobacteria bacterium]|nr:HAD-IC family P-type ATPase [Gammaproteobacteria bacterium]
MSSSDLAAKGNIDTVLSVSEYPHACVADDLLENLQSTQAGLSQQEALARIQIFGKNTLPQPKSVSPGIIFLRQFLIPLIYILLAAAIVSILVAHYSDAVFIFIVLLVNAVIGSAQEYSAQKSATALQQLISHFAKVLRNGEVYELDAGELVPGDIVLLESGDRIPADLRLLETHNLQIDESLMTGESFPVSKNSTVVLPKDAVLGDQINMAFSGSLVSRGRGLGVVITTGSQTQLGNLADAVLAREQVKPPLLLRMEEFTFRIAILVGIMVLILAVVSLMQGMPWMSVLLLAAALAVSVIPEGLPVALTVALAISTRRMARKNVVIRRLVTVEALGSCTYIVTDKTGTLTVNELTVRRIVFAGVPPLEVSGEGMIPEGGVRLDDKFPVQQVKILLDSLAQAVVLTNEGFLGKRDGSWAHHGDAVDVAMLVLAHKLGIIRTDIVARFPEISCIPFESSERFSASLHLIDGRHHVFVKGALEAVLPMCTSMMGLEGEVAIDKGLLERQVHELADEGYRVLVVASGIIDFSSCEAFSQNHLRGLTFIAMAGMIDPLRAEARSAIEACYGAGMKVAMVTGDHPVTALAIAKELDMASDLHDVVIGREIDEAVRQGEQALDAITKGTRVFARIEPRQKLDIVQSLQRQGHFVAVTGDGANDAPALRAAHVGVAMGKSGTDVAREASDMMLADDNFASIVNGVEQGRVAYANVRKVVFLLISTGMGELVLFLLSLLSGLPLPLTAVQLLWLNLVTNGIQDVALAFEPAEGDELRREPRPPKESVFNRIMIQRVILSAVVIGTAAFMTFQWFLSLGYEIDQARNGTLLLMVLFENIHAFNSRSETRSVFIHNLLSNPFLLYGTIGAQLLHIGAMYTPGLRDVLH